MKTEFNVIPSIIEMKLTITEEELCRLTFLIGNRDLSDCNRETRTFAHQLFPVLEKFLSSKFNITYLTACKVSESKE